MADKVANFMVVLRGDISPTDLALLSKYPVLHSLRLSDGITANIFWCRKIDPSGPYLTIEAKHRDAETFVTLQIPHWLVLTIVGSKDAPAIGFLTAGSTPPSVAK